MGLSAVVWAYHLFTSGMSDFLNIPFMVITEIVSIPTGVIFLSALGTIWLGRLLLKTPMLFALGVVFNFLIGGLTGIFLADAGTAERRRRAWPGRNKTSLTCAFPLLVRTGCAEGRSPFAGCVRVSLTNTSFLFLSGEGHVARR